MKMRATVTSATTSAKTVMVSFEFHDLQIIKHNYIQRGRRKKEKEKDNQKQEQEDDIPTASEWMEGLSTPKCEVDAS